MKVRWWLGQCFSLICPWILMSLVLVIKAVCCSWISLSWSLMFCHGMPVVFVSLPILLFFLFILDVVVLSIFLYAPGTICELLLFYVFCSKVFYFSSQYCFFNYSMNNFGIAFGAVEGCGFAIRCWRSVEMLDWNNFLIVYRTIPHSCLCIIVRTFTVGLAYSGSITWGGLMTSAGLGFARIGFWTACSGYITGAGARISGTRYCTALDGSITFVGCCDGPGITWSEGAGAGADAGAGAGPLTMSA